MTVSKEQQMHRLEVFTRLKGAIETAVGKYRHSDLTDSQLTAQIFLAIFEENIAFYLDEDWRERMLEMGTTKEGNLN